MRVRATHIAGAVAIAAVALLGIAENVVPEHGVREHHALRSDETAIMLVSNDREEDQPGWECWHEGNGICGTPAPEGVGPIIGCIPSIDLLDWTCTAGYPTRFWTVVVPA